MLLKLKSSIENARIIAASRAVAFNILLLFLYLVTIFEHPYLDTKFQLLLSCDIFKCTQVMK